MTRQDSRRALAQLCGLRSSLRAMGIDSLLLGRYLDAGQRPPQGVVRWLRAVRDRRSRRLNGVCL